MLPDGFPFHNIFDAFLQEYAECTTYWYVPKWRAVKPENVEDFVRILKLVDEEFLERKWDRHVQDEVLSRLRDIEVLEPYKEGDPVDRTALPRIMKKQLEMLGLLWVKDDQEVVITKAGAELMAARERGHDLQPIISRQVAKMQYPNPSVVGDYNEDFEGVLPHVFLLQILEEVGPITNEEFEVFVNLAQSQTDAPRIARYIKTWRDLAEDEQEFLREIVTEIPMASVGEEHPVLGEEFETETDGPTRKGRIRRDAGYQRRWFTYPAYLEMDDGTILVADSAQVEEKLKEHLEGLKITRFETMEDWITYYGDPEQRPSWFTYLTFKVTLAETEKEAAEEVESHGEELDEEEREEIRRLQIEKGIEDFYVERLELLENGLTLYADDEQGGRQYVTGIGRIDLLCRGADGSYVVVEIKAEDATDSVFGQIQRYMGWIHRHFDDGEHNVRGIILAGLFPNEARYSRIGLLRNDYRDFLQFKRHGLGATDT